MDKMREEFEKYWIDRCSKKSVECVLVRMIDGEYYNISAFYAYEGWKAAKAQALPDGWKPVPVEPTEQQFGGMARDIIQWLRFTESKNQHSESLVKWLKDMGNEIPSWLYSEREVNHLSKHVISKGTIAAIIYKAMLEAAPEVSE